MKRNVRALFVLSLVWATVCQLHALMRPATPGAGGTVLAESAADRGIDTVQAVAMRPLADLVHGVAVAAVPFTDPSN